jgi:hypothetical protein
MAFSFTVGRIDEHGRTTEITVRSDYNYVIMENMDNTEHSENRILLTSETTVFMILQHIHCTSRRNKIASITFLNEVTKKEVIRNKAEIKDEDEHDWSDMDDILKMHPSMINGRFTVTIQNKVSPPRPDATYMELLDYNGKSYIRDYRNHVWEWIPFKGAGAWCGVYDPDTDTIRVEN